MIRLVSRAVWFFSGEFLLDRHSNGGAIVIVRTIWTTAFFYSIALCLRAMGPTDSADSETVLNAIASTVHWLGAIFAGVYAALYARFVSQWTYLADLYNRQMEASLIADNSADNNQVMARWEASFVEDAIDLHLAGKPMFAEAVLDILERPASKNEFLKTSKCPSERELEIIKAKISRARTDYAWRPLGDTPRQFFLGSL